MDGATTPPTTPVDAIVTIYEALREIQFSNYSCAAGLAFLLWDVCITMDAEVRYIWRSRWSLPKFLYIFTRYFGLGQLILTFSAQTNMHLTQSFCSIYYWFTVMAGPAILTACVNLILLLRVHAIYQRSRKVLIFLVGLIIVELGIESHIFVVLAIAASRNAYVIPNWPGCVTISTPRLLRMTLISWIPTLIVATVFFLMTMYKLFEVLQDGEGRLNRRKLREMRSFSPLFTRFVQDGAIFFLVIFTTLIVCTVSYGTMDGPMVLAVNPWITAAYSFSCSRLMLGLREAGGASHTDPSVALSSFGFVADPDGLLDIVEVYVEEEIVVVETEKDEEEDHDPNAIVETAREIWAGHQTSSNSSRKDLTRTRTLSDNPRTPPLQPICRLLGCRES